MKLTAIEIGSYYQFKDFKIDFTSPQNNGEVGVPLKKICFIGQSGTGKTTLINLIQFAYLTVFSSDANCRIDNDYLRLYRINFADSEFVKFSFGGEIHNHIPSSGKVTHHKISFEAIFANNQTFTVQNIYIDGKTASKMELFSIIGRPTILHLNPYPKIISYSAEPFPQTNPKVDSLVYIFDIVNAKKALDITMNKIKEFKKREVNFRYQLAGKIKTKKSEELNAEMEKWELQNPNPAKEIAIDCLDDFLRNFQLKTETEMKDTNDLSLRFQNINSNSTIPWDNLPTGAKQIIVSAIPLYSMKPENALIVFDEPERSLFPDLQQILVKYYTSFSDTSQYFFVTHSPIVASQFQPEERFILKFDEQGYVKAKNGISPEGDDPNDLLSKDFNIHNLHIDEAARSLKRYIELKGLIRVETDSYKKELFAKEFLTLGMKYNFGNEKNS